MRPEYLLLGLGNPGPRYDTSRHNVGFALVDRVATGVSARFRRLLFRPVLLANASREAGIVLAKPMTFMNRSGAVVPFLLRRLGVPVDRMIVVTDNLDLPPGTVRLKRSGGGSTHNGLRSIIEILDTTDFPRLYVGIGRPPIGVSVVDHVLSPPEPDESAVIDESLDRLAPILAELSYRSFTEIINRVNRTDPSR